MLATFPTMDDDEDRVVLVGQRNISPSPSCRNEHELCGLWAAMGECQANPRYMEQICAPVCHSCHHSVLLLEHQQSPFTWNPAQNSWESGDLDRMFRRLTSDPYLKSKHKIQIHSSPDLKDGDDGDNDGGPWIITMEGVVDPEEAEQFIEHGEQEGFQASTSSTMTMIMITRPSTADIAHPTIRGVKTNATKMKRRNKSCVGFRI